MAKKETEAAELTQEEQAALSQARAEAEQAAHEAEKARAMTDYDKRLAAVKLTAEMTDTEAWGCFYQHCRHEQRKSLEALKVAEKTREIIQHQEAIKAVDKILGVIELSANNLGDFITTMPLFSAGMKTRAEFDPKTGRVVMRTIP